MSASEPPATPGIHATASLIARLRGHLGRLEISDIVWGAISLCVLAAGLYVEKHGSRFADLLVLGAVIAILVLLLNRATQSWLQPAGPVQTLATIGKDGVVVRTTVASATELLALARALRLGRNRLPAPAGEIVGDDPSAPDQVRLYTPAESEAECRRIENAVTAHDRALIERADQIVQQFNGTGLTEPAQSTGPGMKQQTR